MNSEDIEKIVRDGLPAHNAALLVLENKGYELGIYPPTYDEGEVAQETEIGLWFARKVEVEFVAGDPLSLLGLAAILESGREAWPSPDDKDLYDELLEKYFPD